MKTIPSPYLLYLGDAKDDLSVKTSRGVATWRPQLCVGEHCAEGCEVSLGLAQLSFADAVAKGAKTLIIGIANAGGSMSPQIIKHAIDALNAGMNLASGLHDRLSDHPDIVAVAKNNGLQIFDIRQPPNNLVVGNGMPRAGRRLLTVGTDCSVGKMYTTLALEKELQSRGVNANFRATGQTGILIAQSGIPIDAVIADFISGSVEMISPARDDGGWDLIEGQGSLFHPSYAGVSLGLLHGAQPDALILCHEFDRPHMRGIPGRSLPDLATCLKTNLEAARVTNADAIAVGVCVNSSRLSREQAKTACAEIEQALGLPCQDPIAMGINRIADRLLECFDKSAAA